MVFSNRFNVFSLILDIAGIIAYFCDIKWLILISAVIAIINSIIRVVLGIQVNFTSEISSIIAGVLASVFIFDIPWLYSAALFLCAWTLIDVALFAVFYLIMLRKPKNDIKKYH